MKINLIFLGISIFIVIGCVSQPPAPIEYNYDKNYTKDATISKNGKALGYEEDEIVSKAITEKDLNLPSGVLDPNIPESSIEDEETIIVPQIRHPSGLIKDHEPTNKLDSSISTSGADISELNSLLAVSNLTNPSAPQQTKINKELLPTKTTSQPNLENTENLTPEKIPPNTPPLITDPKFIKPVEGKIIIKFGDPIPGGRSKGINIMAKEGSNVYAVAAGIVVFAGNNSKFGNLLIIKLEGEELYVAYAHLTNLSLAKDAIVAQGDIIGYVGHTGNVETPQLYFAINEGKVTVDPLKYIKFPT